MPRKSSLKMLPPAVRHELDRILADDRLTLDEIVEHLRTLGAEVSRSSVHRYKSAFDEAVEDIRLTREMAKAVGQELSDLADGDATPYIVESLQVLLLKVRKQLVDEGDIAPKDLAALARAAKDLASALRINVDMVAKAREEEKKAAERRLEQSIKQVSDDAGRKAMTPEQALAQVMAIYHGEA